ncbi:MAG: EF-P lysine aminoacylase GenX [Gammaproteobacteria bacterium]|nr:MAG: EF-P lysine aminoacylase GenX [Gammaproteobacteria bacterium]
MTLNPDWRPSASLDTLRLRARILTQIRAFFAARGVLEVDTPLLGAHTVCDPHLDSLSTRYTGPGAPHGATLYLQTSPEFAMKRLLASGAGPIYQICKAFRDGEAGRLHNPEFTLVEWYRPGFDHRRLMDEVDELVSMLLSDHVSLAPSERLSYQQAFLRHAGVDPHRAALDDLQAALRAHGAVCELAGRDALLDALLTHCVEPHLGQGRLCFIHGYPASQAALARLSAVPGEDYLVAERFELYLNGIELANGFHELGDAAEQRQRFSAHNAARRHGGKPELPADERLLAALVHGLPDCAGVAVGFDRLLMLACGAPHLASALTFPMDRA